MTYNDFVSTNREIQMQRAVAAACRDKSSQLFYAVHLLPKAQRFDVLTLRAALHQLHEIMFAADDAGGCCQSQPAGPHQVCHSVLDHLWSGQETGKDELDGFSAMQQSHDLPRERFDRIINGWAGMNKLSRIATWARFRELHTRVTSPMVDLLLSITGQTLESTARLQAESIALAMSITHVLAGLHESLERNEVPLPLDDLVRFKLSDRELLAWAANDQPGDERFVDLVHYEARRAMTLFHGGVKAAGMIDQPAIRRALAVLARSYEQWLARLIEQAARLTVEPVTMTRWQRVRALGGVYGADRFLRWRSEGSADESQQPISQTLK